MKYCHISVVMLYKDLSTYENNFTAFMLEDTTELVQTRHFVGNLHSNSKYEILGMEYEIDYKNFTDPTDPKICNTFH